MTDCSLMITNTTINFCRRCGEIEVWRKEVNKKGTKMYLKLLVQEA